MTRIAIPIAGPRSVNKSLVVNAQRALNLYPEVEGDGAKAILTMKCTPAMTRVLSAGNGPCRSNIVEFADAAYYVSGAKLIKVTSAWASSEVGTLNTTTGQCHMVAGRDYLLVTDGGDGYTWDGTTFATVVDGDFPANPGGCAYIAGYFVTFNAGTDQFQVSANEDPTSWAALDFASAEADPDNAAGVLSTYRDLYVFGDRTTQVYYLSDNVNFPFSPYVNGVLEFGLHAPDSLARAGGFLFLVAREREGSPTVLMVQGFQAKRIGSGDTADTLAAMTTTDDAVGYAYTDSDQTFYVLTFPTEDITLVYHVEQDMWHERGSYGLGQHRSRGHGYFNGKHLVGDYADGSLHELDDDSYTDNGATITRRRVAGVLHREGRQFEVNEFEVEFQRGVGLASGQGSDPQAMLRYSCDNGRTWSSELWRDIGPQGNYGAKALWHRLGQMDAFTAEITVTDPVEVVIVAAYADINILDA